MANTTNFGWETPDDTDLVKDGAAAIRTLGSAIDTSLVDLKGGTTGQVLAKASNTDMDFTWATDASGIPATIFDAKGDIIAASAADTAARLAVGANGTVLTADSAETTGLKWATPASAFGSYTLLNTGGTALTGAATITMNVATKENYMILISNASAGASSQFQLRINGDSGGNYNWFGGYYSGSTPSAVGAISQTQITFARMGSDAGEGCRGGIFISGGSTTGGKAVHSVNFSEGTANTFFTAYSVYAGSAAVTSISLISTVGNFDAGTAYVWGS